MLYFSLKNDSQFFTLYLVFYACQNITEKEEGGGLSYFECLTPVVNTKLS